MHYSSQESWTAHVNGSRALPPRAPATPWMCPVQLPNGDTPFFSDSTPTSSIRQNLGGPSLHPLIQYDPAGRLYYDLHKPITHIRFRTPQHVDLRQPATNPVVGRMAIRVQGTSWVFNIQNPRGISVEDVLTTLYHELQRVVQRGEYPTFQPQLQNHASSVFHTRTRNQNEHVQGMKRIDFLHGKSLFLGLARATDGSDTWVMSVAENS